jgi:hypothetical protein
MTLTMIPDLLPHEARPVVFLDQADVVDVSLLLVMNDDAIMNRRGPVGSAGQYDSRHSMSSTCGPRDMISLVTPSLGGNMQSPHGSGYLEVILAVINGLCLVSNNAT